MSKIYNKKINAFIQNQKLKPLIEQAKKIENANKQLKHFLPEPLSEHVIVSNIKSNTLILQTNSPAWSTRTNYIATEIVNYMRNEGGLAMVERLKVKVIPQQAISRTVDNTIEPLSETTSDLLKSVALGINNKALSNVLLQLSKHTKQNSEND